MVDARMLVAGRYELLERLGAGGMGVVHRARAVGPAGFERTLALKSLRPELAGDPRLAALFRREARLSARLAHRCIVQVFELVEADGQLYLVQELVDGCDLGALVRAHRELGRPLPLGVVCYVGAELAAALACAHEACDDDGRPLGLVHRDASPSNVLLSLEGEVKLGDFGIAKAVAALDDAETRTRAVKGKLPYLSPEQAHGRPVDARSDLFTLGALLFECLTLRPAFAADDLAALDALWRAPPRSLRALRPEVPAPLEAIVQRLLAPAPADRFASAAEVAAALAPWVAELRGGPLTLRPLMAAGRAAARRGREGDSRIGWKRTLRLATLRRSGWPRRAVVTALAVGVLVAALALSSGWLAGRTHRPPADAIGARTSATAQPATAVAKPTTPTTTAPTTAPTTTMTTTTTAPTTTATPRPTELAAPSAPAVTDAHTRSRHRHVAPPPGAAGSPPRARAEPSPPSRAATRRTPDIVDPFVR